MFIYNREILKPHYERALASDLFSIDNRKPWTSVFEESSLKPTEKNYMLCHALIALSDLTCNEKVKSQMQTIIVSTIELDTSELVSMVMH